MMDLGMKSSWRSQAACLDVDPEELFPKGRPSSKSKSYCDDCPVRQECLEFALSSPWPPRGIWAGLAEKQLQPLWHERQSDDRHDLIQRWIGLTA